MNPDNFVPIDLSPDPVIEAFKKDVDVTLLRENLKKSVDERLKTLMGMQRWAEEMARARREQASQ